MPPHGPGSLLPLVLAMAVLPLVLLLSFQVEESRSFVLYIPEPRCFLFVLFCGLVCFALLYFALLCSAFPCVALLCCPFALLCFAFAFPFHFLVFFFYFITSCFA